jgi:thiamine-monophosphate kinase
MRSGADHKTVATVGEFGLIKGISNHLRSSRVKSASVVLSTGDDAAIWQPRSGTQVVISTDMLIEGIHFRHDWSSGESVGHRALAVNVSDIAAMGARPRVAVVSLGLRATTHDKWVYDFYKGALALGHKCHFRIIGGDIVRSRGKTIISVTVHGELPRGAPGLRRDRARPGDVVAVTGPLGLAASGVRILTENSIKVDGAPQMLDAHRRPEPKVLHGMLLRRAGVEAAMDLSDGLFGDLPKVCEASDVTATLRRDQIPIPSSVRWNFTDWFDLGTRGGEDFELLFTCPPETFERVIALFRRWKLPAPIAIGTLAAAKASGPAVRIKGDDLRTNDVETGAFDHFQPAAVSSA